MNKVKSFLLGYKLRCIKRVAPDVINHWNETNKTMTFYLTHSFDGNIKPIVIKKPIWLRVVEFFAYRIFK